MAGFMGKAQVNLDDYKYVVVPKKFGDLKEENQYRSSTLMKHLFSQKGFATVYHDDLPDELNSNKCLGLFADLIDDSSMFTTKTTLILNDCNGKEVLLSQQGKSKKKDYTEAYSEAMTNAFNSFVGLNYSYKPRTQELKEEPITVSFKNDVKTVEGKSQQNMQQDSMIVQEVTIENQSYKDRRPIASDYKKAEEVKNKTTVQKAIKEEQSFESREPITTTYKKGEPSTEKISDTSITGVLYAQELTNGYQLVDSTPKIQLKIYKSSMPNVYLAKADNKDGLVYTSDGKWFFEYYGEGRMVVEELQIKF